MWKSVVLVCALAAVVRSQDSTAVSRCLNFGGDLPINTYIQGCITPPCLLPQLSNVELNIIFQAPHTIRSMKTLAKAFILGTIGVDHPLGPQEATCNFLTNTYCPLMKGEVVQYTLSMFMEPLFFVNAAANIEFRIEDENEVEVVCFRVPIRVIASQTPATAAEGRNSTMLSDSEN